MKVSKSQSMKLTKRVPKLSKNPNDRTGALKAGALSDFKHPLLQNIKKLKGGPLGDFFGKKVTMPKKNLNGNPLVSPGIVCYREKKENIHDSVRMAKWFKLTP